MAQRGMGDWSDIGVERYISQRKFYGVKIRGEGNAGGEGPITIMYFRRYIIAGRRRWYEVGKGVRKTYRLSTESR